jgi:hypothetical protein
MKPTPPSEALGMRPAPLRAAFLAACLGAALGCAGARDAASRAGYALNPFASTEVAVHGVSAVGPYLLVEVVGRKERLRLLVPASPACAEMLQPEAQLRYQKSGLFGRLQRDEASCDPDGVASLAAWRNRQPRHRTGTQVIPRATARFAVVHESEHHLLLRGRFPLASRIGIPSGFDLVALLPASAVCRAAAARGEVSLEFRPAGNDVFRLLAGGEACVIEGFARPIDAAAERAQRLPGSSGVKLGS